MRRILCLWFPNWMIQRLQTETAGRSAAWVVLADAGGRGIRVAACCSQAGRHGVVPGMPFAEARAQLQSPSGHRSSVPDVVVGQSELGGTPRVLDGRDDEAKTTPFAEPQGRATRKYPTTPGVIWKPVDPAADRQALRRIALQCQQYTPLAGIDDLEPSESILLDLTGCAHLFGDERRLLTTIAREFARRRLTVRMAIADTIGTAWAVAHHRPSGTIVPAGEQGLALDELPIAGLRLSTEILTLLQRLDLRTIGRLRRLPRQSLPSRFGPQLLKRLDQALGGAWESFTPERLAEPISSHWSGEDSLTTQQEVVFIFRQLLTQLLTQLSPSRAGLLELRCELRAEGQRLDLPLRLSRPSIEAKHILQLFDLACERQSWAGPITAFRLEAVRLGPLEEHQAMLLDTKQDSSDRELGRLIERLTSRLGDQAVLRLVCIADPLPEYSLRLVPWMNETSPERIYHPDREIAGSRPWQLFPKPQPVELYSIVPDGAPYRVHWQGRTALIVACWGPERIHTGWWRSRDSPRDYYRIATDHGTQLWVFRDGTSGGWYLHGVFN